MILNLLTAAASLLIRNYNPKFKHKNIWHSKSIEHLGACVNEGPDAENLSLGHILQVGQLAKQVATKPKRSRKNWNFLAPECQMSNWTKMACLYMRYFVANSRFVAILICTFWTFFCFLTTFCCCVAYFRFLCNIFLSFLYFCSKIVNTRQKWGICCELATTRLKKNFEVILRWFLTPCLALTSDFTNTALCLTRCVWVLILQKILCNGFLFKLQRNAVYIISYPYSYY